MSEPSGEDARQLRLLEDLEVFLLGEQPHLSEHDIVERLGLPHETARQRWRSLGFTDVEDDEVAFTEADLQALERTERLHDMGFLDPVDEAALIRTLGQSYARLADWQISTLAKEIDLDTMDDEELSTVVAEVLPVIEEIQTYVWRRHILNAAARRLLSTGRQAGDSRPAGGSEEPDTAVGFADIVGYTRQSRSLARGQLAALVEGFEAFAQATVNEHGGRIIKSLGDEVLFVADSAAEAALIGLTLVEGHEVEEQFPQLHVGMAWGQVLSRLGDVFGPTVNMASRLTSLARPGRVLVDRDLADQLAEDSRFRLRRLRRTSVKGYRHLEPWNLRRSDDESIDLPVADFLGERREDLLRFVEDLQARAERSSPTERL